MATTTTPKPRSLAELHRRTTTYEIVADLPNGERVRLGFRAQISKATLLDLARAHADVILPHVPEDAPVSYSQAGGWKLGPVTIRRSGRTERECAVELLEADMRSLRYAELREEQRERGER